MQVPAPSLLKGLSTPPRQRICRGIVRVRLWRESIDFHTRVLGLVVREQVPGCVARVAHPGADWLLLGTLAKPRRFENVLPQSGVERSVRIEVQGLNLWSALWIRGMRSHGLVVTDVQRQPWGAHELTYEDNEGRRWTFWQKKLIKA